MIVSSIGHKAFFIEELGNWTKSQIFIDQNGIQLLTYSCSSRMLL